MSAEIRLNNNLLMALSDIERYIPPMNINTQMLPKEYAQVLVTGANGYLGVHLIDELMRHTKAVIHCAIRGDSLSAAKAKLDANLKRYGFDAHIDHLRLKIVIVNLAETKLGLGDDDWKSLSEQLDAIYHNGAYVHHLQSYERMAPTNVGSTAEIIKLACHIKPKRIHFISTKYAAVNCVSSIAREGMPPIAPIHPDISFGYTVTKWAAEWLLWKAQEHGVAVDIYRLGQITGQSTTAKSNYEKNNLTRFILGCIEMGVAPDLCSQHEMIPVDQVAQSIVALSQLPYTQANGWNIVNNVQITHADIFGIINDLGHPVEIIASDQWRSKLREIAKSNPLFPLIDYYDNEETIPFITTENSKTMSALKHLGVNITEDYHALFARYLDYWQSLEFSSLRR
ncbi:MULTISPECIES: thioester reductase domain-containing protein [Cysteiniphilum]|uniref:thioester reductase domain-containing protein n=1 Tax=Cysteiniphilum TaxID=2056696 RepID=UPI00177BD1C2|nr:MULTISPECIES: thioester reductase domain-containing protein [Cysteiniphilum]